MAEIIAKRDLTLVTRLFVVRAPLIARNAQPGQFVILRVSETGERVPISLTDFDAEAGTVTIVVQEVGKTSSLLCALEPVLEPPRHVVLVGDPATADFRALAAVVRQTFGRQRAVLAVTGESDRAWFANRQPWLADMKPVNGRAAAYVCEEFTCQAPVTTAEELRRLLA